MSRWAICERLGAQVRRSSGVARWRTHWGLAPGPLRARAAARACGEKEVDRDAVDGFGGDNDEVAFPKEFGSARGWRWWVGGRRWVGRVEEVLVMVVRSLVPCLRSDAKPLKEQ